MKIYSWNVNGIRAVERKGLLRPFIDTHQPDILCLQETKATEESGKVDLPGYEEYWGESERKGYSGTAIFTKISPDSATFGLPEELLEKFELKDIYGSTATEGRITTLEFPEFYVVSVYTPNAKDDLTRLPVRQAWDAAFLAYVEQLQVDKPVIVGGDLNVAHTELDLARPKENRGKKGFTDEERAGIQALLDAGLIDTFRIYNSEGGHYSWWSHFAKARERNVGWRIDYLLVSSSLTTLVQTARIHSDVFGSDHCPVSVTLAL